MTKLLKQLGSSVREYKKPSILSAAFVSMEVLMEVIIPLVMVKLIDDGVDAGHMGNILKYGGILLACCLTSLLFGVLAGKYAAEASSGFARNLRHDMYYRVQDYSFANIDKFSTSSIVTRLTTDVTNVQNAYQMIVRVAVRSPMMLIFSLIMSFRLNHTLSLVFLCVIPILGVGLALIMTHAHPIFERVFKTYDKLNRVVQENLRGIRVVKSFVREEHEIEKFENVSQSIYADFSKAEKLIAFNSPLMQFCAYGGMLIISWFGAKFIVGGTMTTGALTSLLTYTMQILMSLMMFSMIFVMIIISRASAERICEILSEESDIKNPESPVTVVKDGGVCFKNVSFSYAKDKDKLCLENINLDIKPGQAVGIIGGTGSSKTSLVQLIPRLYDVTEGSLTVGGVDVRDYDIESLRDKVAMVLQKNVLFSGTIKENLRWGNENATDEEIVHACKIACADEFINTFPDGYDTYIEQGGANVSGGQKQRLCIARALLKNPKIIILDDSTSAVDTKTDSLIRTALVNELPETTKIVIAQRISSIEGADKIIVLDGGKIVAAGRHEELINTCDIYKEVYESQTKGGKLK